ncbi:MAG: hypothetical protein QOJ19_1437 [Acidimicrobiia bacterium]|nr:hypothetical protein [Acidimicrobiia bacterium]
MPDLRTVVTEVVTGLGTLGRPDLCSALDSRPSELVNVAPATWELLSAAHAGGGHGEAFIAAWDNGLAFLAAREGLRQRKPMRIEWKGSIRAPGDEVVPADLRIDHVFLISCKYLSRIVINASPAYLFDRLLRGGHGIRAALDWFDDVAPAAYQALYRAATGHLPDLPTRAVDLTPVDRRRLAQELRGPWPEVAVVPYDELTGAVALATVGRWSTALRSPNEQLGMLWRLLRIGSTPYYVLGSSPTGGAPLRLRVTTAWDWQQQFRLRAFEVFPQAGGQPRVGWRATVLDRFTGLATAVEGHVEVRWSHGRFSGPPEAKVYLDTPHVEVPGYVQLE